MIRKLNSYVIKILYLSIMVLSVVTCSNESVNDLEFADELTIKSITYIKTFDEHDKIAEFDEEGKITKVYLRTGDFIQIQREYIYNEFGFIWGFDGYLTFEYNEEGVFVRRVAGHNRFVEFIYNGNLMTGQGYDEGITYPFYTVYEFEDETYTKLLSVITYTQDHSNELLTRWNFQYDVNNLIEVSFERINEDTGQLRLESRWSIAYDDQKNPWKKGLPDNAYIAYSTMLMYDTEWPYNLVYNADNNIVELTYESFISDHFNTISKSFIYNGDGYPIEASTTYNGELIRNEYYEYY